MAFPSVSNLTVWIAEHDNIVHGRPVNGKNGAAKIYTASRSVKGDDGKSVYVNFTLFVPDDLGFNINPGDAVDVDGSLSFSAYGGKSKMVVNVTAIRTPSTKKDPETKGKFLKGPEKSTKKNKKLEEQPEQPVDATDPDDDLPF